jgi:hypothetical protein
MRSAFTVAFGFLHTLVLVRAIAAGGLADSTPPYLPSNIVSLLQDEKARNALNIVSYQKAGIKTSLAKWSLARDVATVAKFQGPDRDARARAYNAQRADELFRSLRRVLSPEQLKRLKQIMLQQWGILVFDFPEIREALRLNAQGAEKLHKIHEDEINTLATQVRDGTRSPAEGEKQYQALTRGVSARVRSALTEEQQRILDDLLGAPHPFLSS